MAESGDQGGGAPAPAAPASSDGLASTRQMGGGTPPPAGGDPPAEPTPAAAPSVPKARADGKPTWLPEKFKSEEDLANSYRELERKQFTRKEEMRKDVEKEYETKRREGVPESPDKYAFEPVKLRDGRELSLNPDDPLLPWFQTIAHDLGLSNAKAQEVISQFLQQELLRGPKWQDEEAKLGPAAEKRLNRIEGWVRGNFEQKHFETFSTLPATAAQVEFFEQVMELSGEPRFVPDESAIGFQGSLTREDLQAMQKDEKYWKTKDPQHIARVRAGYRKLAQQNGTSR